MSALNVSTETSLSNKFIPGNLNHQKEYILGSSVLSNDEQLLKMFPSSALSESALAEEERIEKEINQVFEGLNSNCFNEIPCISEEKAQNRAQVEQVNCDLSPAAPEDCFKDVQKGMSQLTLDILINEPKETLPITNIINEKTTSDNTTDDLSTHPIEEKNPTISESINEKEPEETDKLIDNLEETKETKELSNTANLNVKEPDIVIKENSPTKQKQAKQKTTKSGALNFNSVILDGEEIENKLMAEGTVVNIDFIAECIADRSITTYNHFRICIKNKWKLKPNKTPNDLAELTSKAKGGDVFMPVQDMELLKQGLKKLLVKI
ncbi:hypothetical protein [Priestia megaterium]|uniref:Uncharacterized protein n=1 Tax=Priestia megaterium TaxID=1404 RepID=A0A6M6E633_PRIMG|nr:hypothetical protein [Priestia megaterium]QJX80996.1 hypothetical protein FDZ14_33440 [Priestia megaterium]